MNNLLEEEMTMDGFTNANLFELSGGTIHVTYSTTSILGGPLFSYRDNHLSLSFSGAEIHIEETVLGQVVTVTLEAIPDLRTVSFSLIVPAVTVMPQSSGTRIKVLGVRTTAPTTIAGSPPGPQLLYSAVYLRGTAQCIVS
ncbi:MAG: hypothetical protein JSS38_04280 [Nitrospira sp.]|nr:hypothetical protein [Nitrospira sp.]MBS0153786.1 hypothetical protein [Nitrospira sp.]